MKFYKLLSIILLTSIGSARLTPQQWAIIEKQAGQKRLLWRIVAQNSTKKDENTSKAYQPTNIGKKVVKIAKSYLGVRYRWGGMSKRGIDCSGLTYQAIRKATGIKLERTSTEQFYYDRHLKRVKSPRIGDLVFFRTNRRRKGGIGHTGIVINPKKHLFIEAFAGKGHRVRISNYMRGRRKRQLAGFRRIKG